DLNPGPPPCEGGVLTRLDYGPTHHNHIHSWWIISLKSLPVNGISIPQLVVLSYKFTNSS
ncbi:MAG: hypothetical protein QW496_04755, partial [Desulfurococcaceae archaeon]